MLKVYARDTDELKGKLLGEFPPDQIIHLIEVARGADLWTGEHTGQYIGYQFVTGNDERVGYLELLFEEAYEED